MKVKTESVCKTREAAKRGERDRPHFFLCQNSANWFASFDWYGFPKALTEIKSFEARIDWSTWGR